MYRTLALASKWMLPTKGMMGIASGKTPLYTSTGLGYVSRMASRSPFDQGIHAHVEGSARSRNHHPARGLLRGFVDDVKTPALPEKPAKPVV